VLTDRVLYDFVIANTQVAAPPLVPELRLRLATDAVPLWQATEEMLVETGIEPPYWAFCWPGSQALARLVLDRPEIVAGHRILDFAAGCGIAAIAADHAGARAVANEIDPVARAAIAINAALNGATLAIEPADLLTAMQADWDLVLAGDVCYERNFAERAVDWLRRRAGEGIEVLLADPGRAYLPRCGLEAVASYVVPTSLALEDRESRDCRIWRVLP
jgi:predicted nicotinamide N-methyase